MNCYGRIGTVAESLTEDCRSIELLAFLESASRMVDAYCERWFYSSPATLLYDGRGCALRLDDLLSITQAQIEGHGGEMRDIDLDKVRLIPYNRYPKWEFRLREVGYPQEGETLHVTGVWGYGNGTANPWRSMGVALSLGEDDVESVAISDAAAHPENWIGLTLRLGEEQAYVESVDVDGVLGLLRGVNETTAAAHTDVTAYRALYPMTIVRAAEMLAVDLWNNRDKEGFSSETLRSYTYQRGGVERILNQRLLRILGPFWRGDRR